MKKLFLLFALLALVVAFSPVQVYAESELETWCKESQHTWDPLGICFTNPNGSSTLGRETTLYIGNNEILVISLSSEFRVFTIASPLSLGGRLIVRGDPGYPFDTSHKWIRNVSIMDIQEGGRLDNYVNFSNTGTLQNAGTLYNWKSIYNYSLPRGGPYLQGIIDNKPHGTIYNIRFIHLGYNSDMEPTDFFINQGVIYHLPCFGGWIGSAGKTAEIGGTNIDIDQCSYSPIVARD